MARRPDPEHIVQTHEAGIRAWLRDECRAHDVDGLLEAWAAEAARSGSTDRA
jgi:hypothetical protein